jgi:hypothetical protein
MYSAVTSIKLSIQRMVCTGCGAEANASCNCGKPYVPKAARAAQAVKANPEKSDRAIAEEIGVSPMTVNRARATVPDVTVDERIGLDGKTRRMPRQADPVTVEAVKEVLDGIRHRVMADLGDGIVEQALALVAKMNPEERRRFDAAYALRFCDATLN